MKEDEREGGREGGRKGSIHMYMYICTKRVQTGVSTYAISYPMLALEANTTAFITSSRCCVRNMC